LLNLTVRLTKFLTSISECFRLFSAAFDFLTSGNVILPHFRHLCRTIWPGSG